jgi:flagellar assembly protein FliH
MASDYIPKEQLTAWERWELAAFDEEEKAARAAAEAAAAAAAAPVEETPPPPPLPTAEEIEQMYEEARQSGYTAGFDEGKSAGYEAGYAAGQSEGNAFATAQAQRIQAIADNLASALGGCEQQVADQLLEVAVELARQMLRSSLKHQPELILPVVREAIAAMPTSHSHPLLFVHPDDARLVRERLGEALQHSGWKLVEDLHLTPGGCRVEVGASEVDATVETRWRRVLEAIGTRADWQGTPGTQPERNA